MLPLYRKVGQKIRVGDLGWITVASIDEEGTVCLNFDFPHEIKILREELIHRPQRKKDPETN